MTAGRRRVGAAAAIALLVGAFAAGSGAAASAASDPIGLSADGTTFSADYPGGLFDGVVLVPGGSATRSFWVKNQESSYGYLALALDNVSSADPDFPSALTIRAGTGAATGQPTAFSAADPCIPVLEGILLSASDVVRIDVTLSLSDALSGTQSQQAIADFDLRVAMTSTDATASDGCRPAIPPPPERPGSGKPGRGGSGTSTVLIPSTGNPTFSPTPQPTDPEAAPEPDLDPEASGVHGNTDRFYQEYYIAWWMLAFLMGGTWAWFRDRRRERISE